MFVPFPQCVVCLSILWGRCFEGRWQHARHLTQCGTRLGWTQLRVPFDVWVVQQDHHGDWMSEWAQWGWLWGGGMRRWLRLVRCSKCDQHDHVIKFKFQLNHNATNEPLSSDYWLAQTLESTQESVFTVICLLTPLLALWTSCSSHWLSPCPLQVPWTYTKHMHRVQIHHHGPWCYDQPDHQLPQAACHACCQHHVSDHDMQFHVGSWDRREHGWALS